MTRLLCIALVATAAADIAVNFTVTSDHPTQRTKISWFDPQGKLVEVGSIAPGEQVTQGTFAGHRFQLDAPGDSRLQPMSKIVTVRSAGGHGVLPAPTVHLTVPDRSRVRVECYRKGAHDAEPTDAPIRIDVHPKWSPLGAARFLDLVETGFYDGVALSRSVRGFLTQFGIAATEKQREQWRGKTIKDDPPAGIGFQPGTLSFAGSGGDSRTHEVFVVMPGCDGGQLSAFGRETWETPFGELADMASLQEVGRFYSYGDMPPWGQGPAPGKIWQQGYEYLRREFPRISYLDTCRVVDLPEARAQDAPEKAGGGHQRVEL